jgi:hypothetical protein
MHDVADAMHVEDHEILAMGIDDAFEFADHFDRMFYFAGRRGYSELLAVNQHLSNDLFVPVCICR